MNAVRVILRSGRERRRLLLIHPPFPEVGEVLTIDGSKWTVAVAKEEKIIAQFKVDGLRLRQVFP